MKNRKFLVQLVAGILALIMVLGLIVSVLPVSAQAAKKSDQIKEEIKGLKDDRMEIWMQMDELEEQQDATWDSIEEMVEQKNNIDQQINLLNREIDLLNQEIQAYAQLIAQNQTELDEAQARLEELTQRNKDRIRAMEEEGELNYWSVLFKANSFTDLIDRLNMIQEIQAADQRRLAELSAAADAVEQARSALEAEKVDLEQSRQEQALAQEELGQKRTEADAILAELNSSSRDLAALYEEYEDKEHELSAEIAKTEKELTAQLKKEKEEEERQNQQTGGTAASGKWVRPCSYTVLTSAYGWRVHPITGKNSFHNGVDLANVQGTPIYAAKSGTVTVATYNGVYGYYVQINHGDGFSSLYGHMTNYTVKKGQSVKAGQVIGYMGSTGWSTGSHLHFTIYYNGGTVNPMNYI